MLFSRSASGIFMIAERSCANESLRILQTFAFSVVDFSSFETSKPAGGGRANQLRQVVVGSCNVQEHFRYRAGIRTWAPAVPISGNSFPQTREFVLLDSYFSHNV